MRWAYHERMRALASIEELAAELRSKDSRLAEAARGRPTEPRVDRPDGYPRGGDGSGRFGGTSDPTGAAVEQRESQSARLAQLAEDAVGAVFEALSSLQSAQGLAARALEPHRFVAPERRPPAAVWCISCARSFPKELEREFPGHVVGEAITFEPRTGFAKRSRADLCNWCLDEWDASSENPARRKLPSIRLVVWRADHPGRYVTERVRAEVLGKSSQVA